MPQIVRVARFARRSFWHSKRVADRSREFCASAGAFSTEMASEAVCSRYKTVTVLLEPTPSRLLFTGRHSQRLILAVELIFVPIRSR